LIVSKIREHELWMARALELARQALDAGEFPVGAVIVHEGQVVAEGHRLNSRDAACNELDHAEILALRHWIEAGSPGRGEAICYSTLEPCLMCTGALIINGIGGICFSMEDVMGGGCGLDFDGPFSWAHLSNRRDGINHMFKGFGSRITGGIMRDESLDLLRRFFSSPENSYLKQTQLARYILGHGSSGQEAHPADQERRIHGTDQQESA
jgi:tRNA(adenine34) deaminase